MQLRLRHGALQTQKKTIVKNGWVIETIFIQNERAGHRADFQQVMPVEGTARKTRDLQPHNQAHMAKSHLSDQALKALTIYGRSSRLSQVLIDNHNARGFP